MAAKGWSEAVHVPTNVRYAAVEEPSVYRGTQFEGISTDGRIAPYVAIPIQENDAQRFARGRLLCQLDQDAITPRLWLSVPLVVHVSLAEIDDLPTALEPPADREERVQDPD